MTDEELKELVAGLTIAQAQAQKESRQQMRENHQQMKESRQQIQEIREIIKEVWKCHKETENAIKEVSERHKETETAVKELTEQQKETDKRLEKRFKELGAQIGGLGMKFGSFTEGLAFPSMEKLLRTRFGMEVVSTRVKSKQNNQNAELDLLGYTNTEVNTVYVVEIKSHLRESGLEQMLNKLATFPLAFPEHANKSLYGIIAAVDAPELLITRTLNKGIYLALIHDDEFQLQESANFTPQCFSNFP